MITLVQSEASIDSIDQSEASIYLWSLLRAVGAEVSLADLNVLVICHVLVVDCATLLKLFVTTLLLMRQELGDIGRVTHLLRLVDTGGHLSVVRVFLEHHFLITNLAVAFRRAVLTQIVFIASEE